MRKLSIPYTKDNRVLDLLTPSELQHVKEIYMPLPYDVMPSGRIYSPQENAEYKEMFDEQIEKALSMDLTVNILASKPIMDIDKGVMLMTKAVRELERIKRLHNVQKVTIGSFTFLKCYGDYISNLGYEIEISVLMNVDCIEKFEQIVTLFPFVSSICVYNNFINNVEELEYLKSKYPNVKIKILANHLCLAKCLTHIEHHNLFSNEIYDIINTEDMEAWRIYSNAKQLVPNCKSCSFIGANKNVNPIRESVFLRPENLEIYDHVIDLFKLSGREHPAEKVIGAVKAYGERTYSGNLVDVVDFPYRMAYKINNDKFPKEYGTIKSSCQHKCYKCNYCEDILKKVGELFEQQPLQNQQ